MEKGEAIKAKGDVVIKYVLRLAVIVMAVYGCFIVWPILNLPAGSDFEITGLFNVLSAMLGMILTIMLMVTIPVLITGLIIHFILWIFSNE